MTKSNSHIEKKIYIKNTNLNNILIRLELLKYLFIIVSLFHFSCALLLFSWNISDTVNSAYIISRIFLVIIVTFLIYQLAHFNLYKRKIIKVILAIILLLVTWIFIYVFLKK